MRAVLFYLFLSRKRGLQNKRKLYTIKEKQADKRQTDKKHIEKKGIKRRSHETDTYFGFASWKADQ